MYVLLALPGRFWTQNSEEFFSQRPQIFVNAAMYKPKKKIPGIHKLREANGPMTD
jgi:hypothetical protein